MYIVTTAQMQAAEKAADADGVTYNQLMENAGQAIAQAIIKQIDIVKTRVLILVGPGNNGGDGLVVARHLEQAGAIVTVYIWKRQVDNDHNWELLADTTITKIFSEADIDDSQLMAHLTQATIIVDALLGTGVSRPIGGTLADLLERTKTVIQQRRNLHDGKLVEPARPNITEAKSDPYVVAVDLPSGLNSDTGKADPYTLTANLTVTLAAVKMGHIINDGPEVTGRLLVGDIKIAVNHYPAEVSLEMVTSSKVAAMLPKRPITAHKGTFGRALLLAGSVHYTGAVMLSAASALRSGVGWVMVACPQAIQPILAGRLPEATYLPLPHQDAESAYELLHNNLTRVTAMLIGPGLGQAETTQKLLNRFLPDQQSADTPIPLVIDADGLNILAKQTEWWRQLPPNCILTPHLGEMARLMKRDIKTVQTDRLQIAQEMAVTWQQVLLLKGAYTIVAAPDGRTMVLPFANPALAKAGSGDVLAGCIVALRAQGLSAFESTIVGAYLHGLAGTYAGERFGAMAVTAGDLIDWLPKAIRDIH